ncbi:MAG: glycosyltransferase family 2 protein [Bacteroidota bacterium]|nr:glycosyltransferase family 2 protein [Bacteroidota bacterium]
MTPTRRFVLIVPAFNAGRTLGKLLEGTQQYFPADKIIVVDDGSSDASPAIASEKGCVLIRHEINRGKGAALQSGFDAAMKRDIEAVLTMDADLQHDPHSIPEFFTAFASGAFDILIGSRLHDMRGMPVHRKLSNIITTSLVRARTGAGIGDSQSGFRLIGKKVLEEVRLVSAGFEAETEFLIKAAARGFRFGSVPIRTIYAGEKSAMTNVTTTINFIRVLFHDY